MKNRNLNNLIKKSKYTVYELAEILQVSPPFLSMVSNGKKNISPKLAERLSEFFEVSIDYLYDKEFDERFDNFSNNLVLDYKNDYIDTRDNTIYINNADNLTIKQIYILDAIRFLIHADEKTLENLKPTLDELTIEQTRREFEDE